MGVKKVHFYQFNPDDPTTYPKNIKDCCQFLTYSFYEDRFTIVTKFDLHQWKLWDYNIYAYIPYPSFDLYIPDKEE